MAESLSLNEIRMNFRVANAMADRLDELAGKMGSLANERYYGTLRSISNNWKGENAEAYLRKGEKVKDKMSHTAGDLRNAAQTVRTIAKNTYDAEMRAWQIAQTRSYS